MAQSGFAFFFLAVLIGCSSALAAWLRTNWQKIIVAVRGEVPAARAVCYRAGQRKPMDVPYVAQRMLAQPGRRLDGSGYRRMPMPVRRQAPAVSQLRLGF